MARGPYLVDFITNDKKCIHHEYNESVTNTLINYNEEKTTLLLRDKIGGERKK